MPRLARVVVPGLPHHITQRGNRRQQTFFCDEDYRSYLELMGQWCSAHQVEIWAYCLMPNHVHLIAVPQSADGLRRTVGEAHCRCTRSVNFREGWRGHLWQGRFASFVLDERYLLTAARYVELNPVRAGLIGAPSRYPWSSAAAQVRGRDDARASGSRGHRGPGIGVRASGSPGIGVPGIGVRASGSDRFGPGIAGHRGPGHRGPGIGVSGIGPGS